MSNNKSRIPNVPADFNSYINNTADDVASIVVPTVQTRFNWTDAEATAWTDKRTFWRDTLYPKYTNDNKSTSVVKGDVKTFIKDFHTVNNNLLDRAAASTGSTSADEALYNFIKERAAPTHQTETIKEKVYALITALGGGIMQFRCRTASDATRSRIPIELGADSVQIAYVVGRIPTGVDDATTKLISTKAMFTLPLGTEASEERLYVYERWYNTRHPELSGPWSLVQIIPIL